MYTHPLTIQYKQWNCKLGISCYGSDPDRKAIVLNEVEDGSPIAVLTKNFPDEPISTDEVALDTNNCGQSVVDILHKAGIIELPNRMVRSGFCTYPVCKLRVGLD